jgi:hypothetical protein
MSGDALYSPYTIGNSNTVCHVIPSESPELWSSSRRGLLHLHVTPYLKGQNVSVIIRFLNTVSVICALLWYQAASSGNLSPTFRDFLTLEDGTDTLSRNVGNGLPFDIA